MKKYIPIVLVLACVFIACSRDEESLFDKNATERAQEALDNANAVLVAPKYGWEMIYFANKESRGYNIIMKFDENGRVTATAKNAATTGNAIKTDSTSTWQVKLDYGPILTFDTYNDVFHAWADPQEDGDGLLGDYEFLILSATQERVVLKGKKHSAYSILRPMPDMKAEDYFADCANALSKYFGNGNILTLQQDGKQYYLHNGSSGLFTFTEYGEKAPAEDPTIYPLCPTLDGFMMSFGFNENKDERLFVFDTNKFKGEKGSVISVGSLSQLFVTYIGVNKGWTADLTNSTGTFAESLTAFEAQLKAITKDNNAKVTAIGYTYSDTVFRYEGSHLLRIKFEYKKSGKKTNTVTDFAINLTRNNSKVVMTFLQPATSVADTWYNQESVSEIKSLINAALGTFELSSTEAINPTKALTLTKDGCSIPCSGTSNLK